MYSESAEQLLPFSTWYMHAYEARCLKFNIPNRLGLLKKILKPYTCARYFAINVFISSILKKDNKWDYIIACLAAELFKKGELQFCSYRNICCLVATITISILIGQDISQYWFFQTFNLGCQLKSKKRMTENSKLFNTL